jgi:hypothetical protein
MNGSRIPDPKGVERRDGNDEPFVPLLLPRGTSMGVETTVITLGRAADRRPRGEYR